MTRATLQLTDTLYKYYLANSLREDPILYQLREETAKMSAGKMQIAPEEGQFLAFIVKLLRAKKTLDVGTFTGYSTLVTAMAMPDDARIITCDINVEWTKIAKKYWKKAGLDHKIELKLAPAIDTLTELRRDEKGTFDFIFIDADKQTYKSYYELSLELIKPGGVIAIDNVLWDGRVADSSQMDESTKAIREFNTHVFDDSSVFITMLPIADGLTLVMK
jgi:predicted O-methyltransferase YrrM